MTIKEAIRTCEEAYVKCFSKSYEYKGLTRFRDEHLKDMYYHNYTFIKKELSKSELQKIIEEEIRIRQSEKGTYCNVLIDDLVDSTYFTELTYNSELSISGYYSYDITRLSELNERSDCQIKQVTTDDMVQDILFCDLKHDEETHGKDFCTRRCYRRGKVYLTNEGVNAYVCYYRGKPVGVCDLFIYNGIAKIEDFAVLPEWQRKGFGTTILKKLINIALNENVKIIYLVTDEDETAKDMYLKLGFSKVGYRTDAFFCF